MQKYLNKIKYPKIGPTILKRISRQTGWLPEFNLNCQKFTLMKLRNLFLLVFLGFFNKGKAQDISVNQFDKRGIAVIDSFMSAIMHNQADENAAAQAAMPYIHRSEYDNSSQHLKQDRMDFSFKKAWQNVKFYKWYAQLTRVQKQSLTAIGFGNTAETGIVYKVWVAKRVGAEGLPAPVGVFFPSNGGDPKIYSYGSF
jgi:hypothetical protein